jgi:hypothetical protein
MMNEIGRLVFIQGNLEWPAKIFNEWRVRDMGSGEYVIAGFRWPVPLTREDATQNWAWGRLGDTKGMCGKCGPGQKGRRRRRNRRCFLKGGRCCRET